MNGLDCIDSLTMANVPYNPNQPSSLSSKLTVGGRLGKAKDTDLAYIYNVKMKRVVTIHRRSKVD